MGGVMRALRMFALTAGCATLLVTTATAQGTRAWREIDGGRIYPNSRVLIVAGRDWHRDHDRWRYPRDRGAWRWRDRDYDDYRRRDRDDFFRFARDGRPYGWTRGRKTGWGDCDLPPGLAKKYGCRSSFFGRRRAPIVIIGRDGRRWPHGRWPDDRRWPERRWRD